MDAFWEGGHGWVFVLLLLVVVVVLGYWGWGEGIVCSLLMGRMRECRWDGSWMDGEMLVIAVLALSYRRLSTVYFRTPYII